jgi:carboxypeptidase C (cathepsin A)
MKKMIWILLMATAASLRATEVAATNSPATNAPPAKNDAATIPDATHKPVFTTNTVTIAGQRVKYVAETGMLPILKADGTTSASVFYIAYTRLGKTNTSVRPVTFCFNGGPGSSSVWLHLGALGPRRVKMNPDGTLPPPPFGLVDNDYSILGASDLVFIDPVATGFSRAAKDEKAGAFFGDSADLDSVGEFIRLWTTRHERWLSPKFLCGESYGVFRAAGLADHLRSRYGMYLNGLILVSRPSGTMPETTCRIRYICLPTRRRRSSTKNCRRICKTICQRRSPRHANLPRANTPRLCKKAIRFLRTNIKKSPPNSCGSPA